MLAAPHLEITCTFAWVCGVTLYIVTLLTQCNACTRACV